MTGIVIFSPADQRDCPDQYLQKYAAVTSGRSILIQVEKRKTQREKEKQQKIFSWKKYSFGKLNHAETINFTTDSPIAMGNLKPYFPFLRDLPFNLIRAGAERSDVPCSF